MQVTLNYESQLKRAIGTATETVAVADGVDAADVVRAAAERHGESVRTMLLTGDGQLRPSVLIFIGDQQISRESSHALADGDTVTVMLPISGG